MANKNSVDHGLGCSQGKLLYSLETSLANFRRLHGKDKPYALVMKKETSTLFWSSTTEVCPPKVHSIRHIIDLLLGMGDSDTPLMRYSTSEMAKDIIELVDHLGWTGERELHIMGVSMGGMISQELVHAIIPPQQFSH